MSKWHGISIFGTVSCPNPARFLKANLAFGPTSEMNGLYRNPFCQRKTISTVDFIVEEITLDSSLSLFGYDSESSSKISILLALFNHSQKSNYPLTPALPLRCQYASDQHPQQSLTDVLVDPTSYQLQCYASDHHHQQSSNDVPIDPTDAPVDPIDSPAPISLEDEVEKILEKYIIMEGEDNWKEVLSKTGLLLSSTTCKTRWEKIKKSKELTLLTQELGARIGISSFRARKQLVSYY
ncbi:hypothetical protein TorRG33x02_350410 [Trema orientale]|uniref:Myb-like domain containing protein n=1 Tax=Trema orientale TaxID=63057 RepID=A0A2P5AHF2_TREOI|nr:hypothetical protein TorRG33x02_350410 [Trema orientale]